MRRRLEQAWAILALPLIAIALSVLVGSLVIVARELSGDVRLLVVAQPTRGLDVGSIEFIHRRIIELRDRGAAVLLVSAELDEVLNLSDRVGVIYRGALVGTFDRNEVSRDLIGLYMASGHGPEAVA